MIITPKFGFGQFFPKQKLRPYTYVKIFYLGILYVQENSFFHSKIKLKKNERKNDADCAGGNASCAWGTMCTSEILGGNHGPIHIRTRTGKISEVGEQQQRFWNALKMLTKTAIFPLNKACTLKARGVKKKKAASRLG
jgi:hypothetical protein